MAFTPYQVFLALLQIFTGSINTLVTKWADVTHSTGSDGTSREFKHPFVQSCAMFLGEFMCLVVFKILYWTLRSRNNGSEDQHGLTKGNRNFNPFILYIPAICDMIGTSLMYVGLNLTFASSFQMFRGAVIIFVAFLSMAFLNRRLGGREWGGIVFVFLGLCVVGVADFITHDDSSSYSRESIITGDLLIALAQILTAIQMVYEERYVARLDIPALQAVGYEGIFGFVTLALLLIPFNYIPVGHPIADNPNGTLEDFFDAMAQIKNSWQIQAGLSGTVVSIAFFNYAGISVTKEISATTRMVLDSVRTMVIWMVSLGIGWQDFKYLQLLGFIVLLFGMCLYNDIVVRQTYERIRRRLVGRNYDNVTNDNDVINSRSADDVRNP